MYSENKFTPSKHGSTTDFSQTWVMRNDAWVQVAHAEVETYKYDVKSGKQLLVFFDQNMNVTRRETDEYEAGVRIKETKEIPGNMKFTANYNIHGQMDGPWIKIQSIKKETPDGVPLKVQEIRNQEYSNGKQNGLMLEYYTDGSGEDIAVFKNDTVDQKATKKARRELCFMQWRDTFKSEIGLDKRPMPQKVLARMSTLQKKYGSPKAEPVFI